MSEVSVAKKKLGDKIETINKDLTPSTSLTNYNLSLNRRYTNPQQAEQFKVYEISELANLDKDSQLKFVDRDFLDKLKDLAILNDPGKLTQVINEYFQKSAEYDAIHSRKPLSPGSPRSKLRRTAAALYKTSLVPQQKIASGSFKQVQMPIGIDRNRQLAFTQTIMKQIGPIWQWDGNLPIVAIESIQTQISQARQLVRVRNLDLYNKEKNTPDNELLREFQFIKRINDTLGNPSYLPKVIRTSAESQYEEYIPHEYDHETIEDILKDLTKVVVAIEELWQKAGVINPDLKQDNLRKRSNGEVVITDWGTRCEVVPGTKHFNSTEIIGGSPIYTAPELISIYFEDTAVPINTESFLSFQLGCILLTDIYSTNQLKSILNEKHGHIWQKPIKRKDKDVTIVSINSDTYVALKSSYPEVQLSQEMDSLLLAMLDDNPANRPNLSTIKTALGIVTEDRQAKPKIDFEKLMTGFNETAFTGDDFNL